MENTVFTIDHGTKVLFGNGSSEQLGKQLKEYGSTRVMFVYDPIMGRLGHAEKLKNVMTAEGLEVVEFNEIVNEPTSDMIQAVADRAAAFKADAVVGFGGGSSMDVAKGAALLLVNEGPVSKYTRGPGKIIPPVARFSPIVLLPTTAGTSADITPQFVFADLENGGGKTAAFQRGTLSIIDPQYTVALPPSVTAVTGMDAFCHAFESYMNHAENWMADIVDLNAISMIYKYLPRAYKDGGDIEARTMMSYASMLAGMGFGDKPCTIGHATADYMSKEYHFAHGIGCSLGLYAVTRYCASCNKEKMLRVAKEMKLSLPQGADENAICAAVVAAIDELMRGLGFKTMKEMGVKESFIEMLIKELPENFRFKGKPTAPNFVYVEKALRAAYAL